MLQSDSRPIVLLGLLLAATPGLRAQVPHASAVVGVISNTLPSEGLWLVDRAGTTTQVTGLLAAGSVNANVNAVAIDPIDGRIWIGSSTTTTLGYVRLTGSTVSQYVPHGTVPSGSISGITFDGNGNPVVSNSANGVVRIDRKFGGSGTVIGTVGSGSNAITRDFAGNLYVGNGSTGQVHSMARNLDGSYQPMQLLGSTSTTLINGLAYAPADATSPEELWVVTGSTPTSPMFRIPLATGGAGVAVPNALGACNWISYDRTANDVMIVTNTGLDRFGSVDRATGASTILGSLQAGNVGTPASIDVHDDAFGRIQVAPRILNGAVGPFDLELGAVVPPGSFAFVGVIAPFVSVVASGVVGADGRLAVALPDVTLAGPLAPGSLQFAVAWFDASFQLVIGSTVSWPEL